VVGEGCWWAAMVVIRDAMPAESDTRYSNKDAIVSSKALQARDDCDVAG
jgi:hypothetical protein